MQNAQVWRLIKYDLALCSVSNVTRHDRKQIKQYVLVGHVTKPRQRCRQTGDGLMTNDSAKTQIATSANLQSRRSSLTA